eukprot:gene22289-biopygen30972
MRLALGSSQRPLLNTPPSRVAVSEDAEDNAYPPLSPLQRSSATPSQPPVHSPLQEFITPRETFTGATATQAASPPHMTTNNLFSSEEEVESPSKRLARTPRQLPEPTPVNQLPASQPSGNRSSSSSDNSGSRPSQSPHGPWGNPGGDPASSSDSDGVPDDEAETGGPPGQPEDQPPSPPDSDDEPPPPPEEDEVPPPPNFQGDVSDADSNDSERHVALMISVGSVLSWQLPTEGSQLHGGSVSHTKAWLLMMKSYIVNIKRDLAVEELWEQMMVQVYENSQPFVLFTDNRAAWIPECNALQTQSSLNGVLQVNEHGQPIMNPATWKLKLIHFYELVKTGLALALKVTPLDAKEEYEKFDCYDNAGLLYPMPRILMSEFTKKYEEFDIRAGQPHYREAMAKVAKLLDRMAPTLKENFGSYKDVTPLGCWAIAKLYKLDQDQHTLERLSGIAQTEASKRDDMTAQGMLLCVSKPPTQRPTVMPRQTPAFPVTQDPSAPKGNNALVVSFRQTPDAETQASSQAIYKPTFDPSTDGTGSTATIPLPSARVSRHVTQAQHRASQDLLMDEMTVLQRDLDLIETPNEISVRATFVIAPDNTIFDALISTPLMAMPGISALPDISQEKLTLRPFLHLSSAEHTATAFYMTLLMHMVTHAHSMESYSYETNSDNTLYLGDVNLLYSTPSPTPAGDNYKEPQDFFTTQLDDVYWRPGQEFLGGQAAVYQASTSCALPVHLDPPTPASLLPGRLQGGLTSCLSHMDPNYLQEGGINNSMPDGAVTPNADRGALYPDCDLFIGHHRDGTEAQRKEMAAMLNRMTPAVARTMEDLREGYKGIVPPMHIEKDNDKQAFTSPYRKPPIEKLAQDKPLQHSPPLPLLPSSAPSPPLAPGRQLDTDLRLAAMSKDTDGLDIHSDQFVLEYLRRGVLGSNWTTSRTRRVLARSRKYRLGASPTGEERIIRILANGIERIVPAPSQRGNTMLMHAVKYFSAALVVVPIPAKEAIHTVYAHSHGVLAHFGAYALCISDNGPEFQGKFKEHLLHNFIDHRTIHPNHPQGNGFVERSVVPVEDWFCPNCKASGITAIPAGRIPETPQKEPNLFPTPQTRSRDRAALACDKMLVIKQVRVQGGLDKAVWGTASFQGPLSRPW